jgi:hypothetical protein
MADSQGGHKYNAPTWFKHLVAVYTGLHFQQIKQLPYIEYLQYRRDAFINWLNQSESGQEYLRNAWRMEQTEPDRAALRRMFGRREG